MTFDFVIKGPVMPLFKACNLGTPTFAPGLGTARKADHLQRPHTRPALRHRLAPALVKAAFLSAHSPCGKATNIQGRRNKRQKQERKGPPQPARKTNAPGDDEKGQDKAALREGTSGPANGPLSGQKEGASRRPGRPEGGRRRGPRAQVGLSQKAEENAPGNRKSLGWRRPTLGVGQGCDTNGRHAAGQHWDSQDAPRVAWDRRAPHPGHLSKEGPGHCRPARRPRFLNKKSDCS